VDVKLIHFRIMKTLSHKPTMLIIYLFLGVSILSSISHLPSIIHYLTFLIYLINQLVVYHNLYVRLHVYLISALKYNCRFNLCILFTCLLIGRIIVDYCTMIVQTRLSMKIRNLVVQVTSVVLYFSFKDSTVCRLYKYLIVFPINESFHT